jgi:hypothetical protein
MGLASGLARWLMSRATSHATAAGFCLSGERRAGSGHVSALDPYSSRGPPRPGTLLGGTWGLPEGPSMPSWEPRTRMHRGPVSYCARLDPMMHPGMYYLPLPRGAFRPAHVVGSGAVLRVTWRRCTTPSYCRRGYP